MNIVMDQGEPIWLDFENGVLEWQTSDSEDVVLLYRAHELKEILEGITVGLKMKYLNMFLVMVI